MGRNQWFKYDLMLSELENSMNPQIGARCPACYGNSLNCSWTASLSDAAQHFVRAEADSQRNEILKQHIEKLWGNPTCDIMYCKKCGLGFAHPFIAGDEDFYNLAYPGTPGYPTTKWEFTRTIQDLLLPHRDDIHAARFLEIGSGVGNFLLYLAQAGVYKKNIVALEYNSESLRILRERGFNGQASDIFSLSEGHFDFIFMFQVLEHMDKLDEIFTRLCQLLNQNGHLYLSVPNPNIINFSEQHESMLDMPPNHISRWSKEAFEAILERHNLRIEQYEIEKGSIFSVCLNDLKYYTLRKSMSANTLASIANSQNFPALRKTLLAGTALIYLFKRLPLWLRTLGSFQELGNSIWLKIAHKRMQVTPSDLHV